MQLTMTQAREKLTMTQAREMAANMDLKRLDEILAATEWDMQNHGFQVRAACLREARVRLRFAARAGGSAA